jgi:hypothetical protein
MPNIFDFNEIHHERLLEELAEQLEGTLKCIAYAGKNEDKKYILTAKRHYRKITKRGKLFKWIDTINCGRVNSAYLTLMDIGNHPDPKFHQNPEHIAQQAEEAIWDELYTAPSYLEDLEEYEKLIMGKEPGESAYDLCGW